VGDAARASRKRRAEIGRRAVAPFTFRGARLAIGADIGTIPLRFHRRGEHVTDILIREVDDAIAERVRQVAVERNWPVNEVILRALRYALGLGGEDLARRDPQDIAHLRGTWNSGETAAFREALNAFEHVEGTPLFSTGEDGAKPASAKRRKHT